MVFVCSSQVAQHIGALDYLLPQEYVQTCKVTHHRAPEQSIDDVYKVMVAELKKEVRTDCKPDLNSAVLSSENGAIKLIEPLTNTFILCCTIE